MSDFVKVGRLDEFRRGRGRVVVVDGERVVVFRDGARIVAVSDRCPHQGASLEDGRLEGGAIECARHGWRFDAASGEAEGHTGAGIRVYEVRIENGGVLLRRPPLPPPPVEEDEPDDWVPFDPEKHLKRRGPGDAGGGTPE
jgi:3-phenylpropionate/trans-cinnamate dioxygenase ferredoxin component